MTIYDLAFEEDHSDIYNLLSSPSIMVDPAHDTLTSGKRKEVFTAPFVSSTEKLFLQRIKSVLHVTSREVV